jgi:hypothetical protein
MRLTLRETGSLGPDRYQVTLAGADGGVRLVECRVIEHRGVWAVRPEPDVFMTGEADAREVTAAVLRFHRARRGWRRLLR